MRGSLGSIARDPRKKKLVDRREEALDLAAPARSTLQREDQLEFEIGGDLLKVLGGKVTAMIGVKGTGDAADMPVSIFLAPDGLAQRESRLQCGRSLKAQAVASNTTAKIIEDNSEPRLCGSAFLIKQPDIKEGVICLPHGIRVARFSPINQVKLLSIRF